MPALGQVVFASDKIIGGFALIEDAYHETAAIHWLNNDRIMKEEPELLEQARALMPYFPVDNIDLLIIKRMGKDISGVGLDPKIIGRMMIKTEAEPEAPTIEMIGICDITDASCGNALGVGLGDFITKQLFNKIDFHALKENILTSTFYQRGKVPIVLENEREILENAQNYFKRRGKDHIKAIIIKDTLHLSEVYVTEPVLNAIAEPENIEIVDPAREIEYDNDGRILTLL